ncbi:hypothetical protein M885DRAFT_623882 [Pelagophyceae sp. CCMP2097]|nr:hypothetical protein M885DRAFT_623882 [Pelagophyceae sp. CCMP2097]
MSAAEERDTLVLSLALREVYAKTHMILTQTVGPPGNWRGQLTVGPDAKSASGIFFCAGGTPRGTNGAVAGTNDGAAVATNEGFSAATNDGAAAGSYGAPARRQTPPPTGDAAVRAALHMAASPAPHTAASPAPQSRGVPSRPLPSRSASPIPPAKRSAAPSVAPAPGHVATSPAAARRSRPGPGGFVFLCNSDTRSDVLQMQVFASSTYKLESMKRISEETLLFCYDYSTKEMLGVFFAQGCAGVDLEPNAFKGQFRAQIRFVCEAGGVRCARVHDKVYDGHVSPEKAAHYAGLLRQATPPRAAAAAYEAAPPRTAPPGATGEAPADASDGTFARVLGALQEGDVVTEFAATSARGGLDRGTCDKVCHVVLARRDIVFESDDFGDAAEADAALLIRRAWVASPAFLGEPDSWLAVLSPGNEDTRLVHGALRRSFSNQCLRLGMFGEASRVESQRRHFATAAARVLCTTHARYLELFPEWPPAGAGPARPHVAVWRLHKGSPGAQSRAPAVLARVAADRADGVQTVVFQKTAEPVLDGQRQPWLCGAARLPLRLAPTPGAKAAWKVLDAAAAAPAAAQKALKKEKAAERVATKAEMAKAAKAAKKAAAAPAVAPMTAAPTAAAPTTTPKAAAPTATAPAAAAKAKKGPETQMCCACGVAQVRMMFTTSQWPAEAPTCKNCQHVARKQAEASQKKAKHKAPPAAPPPAKRPKAPPSEEGEEGEVVEDVKVKTSTSWVPPAPKNANALKVELAKKRLRTSPTPSPRSAQWASPPRGSATKWDLHPAADAARAPARVSAAGTRTARGGATSARSPRAASPSPPSGAHGQRRRFDEPQAYATSGFPPAYRAHPSGYAQPQYLDPRDFHPDERDSHRDPRDSQDARDHYHDARDDYPREAPYHPYYGQPQQPQQQYQEHPYYHPQQYHFPPQQHYQEQRDRWSL